VRLRTKLLFVFLASSLFLLVEGLAAAYSLRIVGQDVDSLERYTQTDDITAQVKTELAQVPHYETLATQGGRARRTLIEHADRTLVLCRSLERLTTTERSRASIARVASAVRGYRRAGLAYAMALEGEDTDAPELRTTAGRAYDALTTIREEGAIEPVGHEARLATKGVVDDAEQLTGVVVLGGLGLAMILTVASAVVLARATAQPIVRLLRAAREVGRGNLDVSVEVRGEDELGELSRAFNDMTSRLRKAYDVLEGEVKQRTEELRQREKDLERERRLAAIGRLAAGVAHEVSNPLTVIAGAAEGLRDRAQEPELQGVEAFEDFPDYLETIESEAYRLKRLVRRLLNFARTRPTETLAVDMAEVLNDAVSLARLDPLAKEHPVEAEIEAPLPVEGDPDALKEAVLNLLFNALRAVRDGGEVAVDARRRDGEVVIEVSDTGVGIQPQDLERLFEPFFSTAKEGEGTGLGLSLVYNTLQRHRGSIEAESAGPGQGATFRMRLPAAAVGELPGEAGSVIIGD